MVAQVCINEQKEYLSQLFLLFCPSPILLTSICQNTAWCAHYIYVFQVTTHSVMLHMYNKLLLSTMHIFRLLFFFCVV